MGSTSDAAHGRLRSAIQSPTPPKTPGWRPCTRGAGAPRRPSLSPPSLPPSLFLSSPHRPAAPYNACREGAAPNRTGPPLRPSRSPSGPPRRGSAAPAGCSPGPAAPGRSPPSAKREGAFSPALKRSRSRPRRDARGARLLGAAFAGREGRRERRRAGGGRLGGLRTLTSAGAGARGGRAALPLPPGALRHGFTIRPIRRGRRGAPAAPPANQRAGRRRAASGARDGAPARAEPFRSFSWRRRPPPPALPAAPPAGRETPGEPLPLCRAAAAARKPGSGEERLSQREAAAASVARPPARRKRRRGVRAGAAPPGAGGERLSSDSLVVLHLIPWSESAAEKVERADAMGSGPEPSLFPGTRLCGFPSLGTSLRTLIKGELEGSRV